MSFLIILLSIIFSVFVLILPHDICGANTRTKYLLYIHILSLILILNWCPCSQYVQEQQLGSCLVLHVNVLKCTWARHWTSWSCWVRPAPYMDCHCCVWMRAKLSSALSDKLEKCYISAVHLQPNGGRTELIVLQCQSQSDEADESSSGASLSPQWTGCCLSCK